MLAMQRARLARLDMHDVWLGVEDSKPNSGSSSESAGASSGGDVRHGDADRQIVPDGADEKDRKSSRASAASSSGRSETRLRPGETNTGNKQQTRCSR